MKKQYDGEFTLEDEAIPQIEVAPEMPYLVSSDMWVQLVTQWGDKSNAVAVAEKLRSELEMIGITSIEELARTPVKKLELVVRAALQADVQALLSAAHKVGGN